MTVKSGRESVAGAVYVDNLARAIREGEPLILSGRDGRLAVEFIRAVYESSNTGMPVILR